jgi:hypothetical protein
VAEGAIKIGSNGTFCSFSLQTLGGMKCSAHFLSTMVSKVVPSAKQSPNMCTNRSTTYRYKHDVGMSRLLIGGYHLNFLMPCVLLLVVQAKRLMHFSTYCRALISHI